MKKYDEEWHTINTLLRFLTDGNTDVPLLVDDYYLKLYDNPAPGYLLREQIKKVQNLIDNAI